MNKSRLMKTIKEKKLDVIISFSEQTKIWYSKIKTSMGYLFIEKDQAELFVDGRYIEYAKKEAQNTNVQLLNKENMRKFFDAKKSLYKKIGVEKEYLTLSDVSLIKEWFPQAELVEISAKNLRIIKSEEEIEAVREAGRLALQALENIKPLIKGGVSEKELDAHLEKEIRLLGAEKGSFDAIVASGVRGALPHGRASEKIVNDGELITIDFGALYKGYCSDITRTFHVGKVTDKKLLEIESVLRTAQRKGIEAVKPGMTTFEIDKVCRDYIVEKGYGEYFVHSTGHGLGVDVHELPNVSSNKKFEKVLEPGMIITVEPGIYIEGFGGIRVEDDILVTENGYDILSQL